MWLDSCFGSTVAGIYFLAESIELSWLFGEPVMEWSDLSFFLWVVYGVK